ncbi:MAG: c-type cytochrome [Thermoleophilaceae bacterium]
MAEGREEGPQQGRDLSERARAGGVPARVLDPQGPGQAVLPVRGGQGRRHGGDRAGGHHPHGGAVRRGARAQGRSDHHHLLPRPEWYFFFLFELLRVVKPPALVFMATIGIPGICLMLLMLLPFYDRGPERHPMRRPVAMVAAVATVAAMVYLTFEGAVSGPPSAIDVKVAPRYEPGKEVAAANGCLGCHTIGENGNTIGPNLTEVGDRLGKDAIARTLLNPTKPMPSYAKLQRPGAQAVRRSGRVRRVPAQGIAQGRAAREHAARARHVEVADEPGRCRRRGRRWPPVSLTDPASLVRP